VTGEIGKCRSIAFACDTSWRWATQNPKAAGHHAKFWRQLILWLAHREDEAGKEIKLRLDRRRVLVGEKLPLEVTFATPDGKPPAGVELQAVVRREGQPDLPVALVRQGDAFRGTVGGLDQADDYTLAVVGSKGPEQYGSAQAKFLVYDEDLELRQLPADLDSLRKLAADTGGEYRPAEEFPKFVKELKAKDLNQETLRPVIENLWDRWEPLAVFILALAMEWTIRKLNGMV
jgi:hypothetical protein